MGRLALVLGFSKDLTNPAARLSRALDLLR